MSAEALKTYLNMAGILSCNVNPYLPALDDIGCTWADAVALIDYGTARAWEGLAPQPPEGSGDPAARLNAILSRSLPDGEIGRLK